MPRGFRWGVYTTDDGRQFAVRVDADYFEDVSREWSSADGLDLTPFPRGWFTRKVRGLDEDGTSQFAVVSNVGNALWTGALTVFQFNASDQLLHICDVVEYVQERIGRTPP